MRIFWSLIAMLALATAAAFALEGREPSATLRPAVSAEPLAPTHRPTPEPATSLETEPAPQPSPKPAPEPAEAPAPVAALEPAAEPILTPEYEPEPAPADDYALMRGDDLVYSDSDRVPESPAATPADDLFAEDAFAAAAERARQAVLELDALAPLESEAAPADTPADESIDISAAEPEAAPELPAASEDAVLGEPAQLADAEPEADADQVDLLIDGRSILGSGTPDDPYRLTWNALASAERTYAPRAGKTELPEWADALTGKSVAIDGYILIPQAGFNGGGPILGMQYQFDGCCIGIPPGPYNSAEINLAGTIDTSSFFGPVAYGTITGTFKADPYLIQNWLMGLFVLNDAEVTNIKPAGAF